MLRTFTKGWYICCYEYWRRNLNAILIFILVKEAFFLERIQLSSLIIKKSNKQIKTSIFMKLTKNLVTFWTRYYIYCELYVLKSVCERSN